jgi:tRNA threonylcarbamoyladenosine biosynthesis protein TsaB
MTGVTLGIETSGFEGSIALRRDGALVDEYILDRRRHAQTLVSQVQTLLRKHQLTTRGVDLVAVSQGPGSFTGLRVGVVFAKTFAFATGCRLAAVDTLQAVAMAAPDGIDHVSAVSDAQREQVFVGNYTRSSGGRWEQSKAVHVLGISAWCDHAARQARIGFAVSGPGLSRVAEQLPETIQILPPTLWNPQASQIASIGEELAERDEFADATLLEPFYLRRSSAEEKRDARRAGA